MTYRKGKSLSTQIETLCCTYIHNGLMNDIEQTNYLIDLPSLKVEYADFGIFLSENGLNDCYNTEIPGCNKEFYDIFLRVMEELELYEMLIDLRNHKELLISKYESLSQILK